MKINLDFYFPTSLWHLKGFMKAFIKPFEAPQRNENKNLYQFSLFVRDRDVREGLTLSGAI